MPSNEENMPDAPIVYGAGWGGDTHRTLTCPSGAIARVHKPGVDKLIHAGVVDDVDFLSSMVQTKHIDRVKGKGKRPSAPLTDGPSAEEIGLNALRKPGMLAKMTELMDKVAVAMVVDPPLRRPIVVDEQGVPVLDENEKEIPLPYDEREPQWTYTDTVDFMDKAHILAYTVGKVSELERFRQQSK
jgi:hypothetical protein